MRTPIKNYLKAPYSRVLIPDGEGAFFAEILEFPGCYAEGRTATEAFTNLEKAASSWVMAASANGQRIPEPSTTPGYSGKVVLRLPRSLHRKAVQYAQRDRCSLNHFFTTSIASRVGAEEFAAQTGTLPDVEWFCSACGKEIGIGTTKSDPMWKMVLDTDAALRTALEEEQRVVTQYKRDVHVQANLIDDLRAQLASVEAVRDEYYAQYIEATESEDRLRGEVARLTEELQAYRTTGLTEDILRRHDGFLKLGNGCTVVRSEEWNDLLAEVARLKQQLDENLLVNGLKESKRQRLELEAQLADRTAERDQAKSFVHLLCGPSLAIQEECVRLKQQLAAERNEVWCLKQKIVETEANAASWLAARTTERDAWKLSMESMEKMFHVLRDQIPADKFDYDPVLNQMVVGYQQQEIIGRACIMDFKRQLADSQARVKELEAQKQASHD